MPRREPRGSDRLHRGDDDEREKGGVEAADEVASPASIWSRPAGACAGAYRAQEKALGGLSAADIKRAKRGTSDQASQKHVARPGTWLSRAWHGEAHQVIVLDDGAEYRGERFASLSAVARKITGAHWSGPRFFGLHSPRLGAMGVTADG